MSILLNDIDLEVARFVLKSKTGGSDLDFAVAQDYYYSWFDSWTHVYPALAESPKVVRSVGNSVAIRHDTTVSVYGKTFLWDCEHSFLDLEKEYEFTNGKVYLYYYAIPTQKPAEITAYGADNIRQTLEIISYNYDDTSGVLTFQCRDTWFKDKELTPRLTSTTFTDLPLEWENEPGAVVFGTSASGVVIDAPVVEAGIDGSNRPYAKLFGGWVAPGHPNKELKALYVKNQTPDIDPTPWLPLSLETDPQTSPLASDIVATGSRGESLGKRRYAAIYTPPANKLLTAVEVELSANQYRCGTYLGQYQYLRPQKGALLSAGDEDFTISFWLRFDTGKLSDGSDPRYLVVQGPNKKREWAVYFKTGATDKPTFGISTNGTSFSKEATWGSALSATTLYHFTCWQDTTADEIGIAINAGTAVTTARAGEYPSDRNGCFFLGWKGTPGLEGVAAAFGVWDRALAAGDRTALYNGGTILWSNDLTDSLKSGLTNWWDLDEQPNASR